MRRRPAQAPRPQRTTLATDNPLCIALEARCDDCLQRANKALERYFTRPEIRYDLRGAAAGMAYPLHDLIRLNEVLLRENSQAFLDDVLPHELAHLIVYQHWGRRVRPHGPEWQAVMQDVFDITPSRTHRFDTRRASPKPFLYHCACPNHQHPISRRTHNDITRGRGRICLRCRSELRLLSDDVNALA